MEVVAQPQQLKIIKPFSFERFISKLHKSKHLETLKKSKTNRNNNKAESEESSDSLSASSAGGSSSSSSDSSQIKENKCCNFCACFESCSCGKCPTFFDKLYYKLQTKIENCPSGCPSIIPRKEDEEWLFGNRKASEFACYCCITRGCIVCLKYLDCLCCPLCPIWDMCKGCDFGYRRFRIQLILHRYHDSKKKCYIPCV